MIVYSTESCQPCLSLKKYLDHKGVEYRTLDADKEPHTSTLVRLTGRKIVPTVVIEGKPPIVGLNYSAIAKAIDELHVL